MAFINEYKDLAEFIYFISGPLMLVGVIVAILQLRQFKKEMIVRASRDSINSSLLIMERKFGEFKSMLNKTFELEGAIMFPEFEGTMSGFSRSDIHCTNNWLEFYDKTEESILDVVDGEFVVHQDVTDFICGIEETINKLETICQYLLSGVADEEYCYALEGAAFIQYVNDLKPFIALSKEGEHKSVYENIIKVYTLWDSRFDHEVTLHKKHQLEERLKNIHVEKPIKVLGK